MYLSQFEFREELKFPSEAGSLIYSGDICLYKLSLHGLSLSLIRAASICFAWRTCLPRPKPPHHTK